MEDSNDGGRVAVATVFFTVGAAVDDFFGAFGAVAAAAVVDDLGDDMLTEILLRMPAKSVIRSSFVCKRWLSLISSGPFLRDYTLRHRESQPPLILYSSDFFYLSPNINRENPLMIRCTFPLRYPKILSSCNGLLLLRSGYHQPLYYVYNPTTEQSRKIILTHNDKYIKVMGLILAFDPLKSPHYKIVCFKATENKRSNQIEVYNSENRAWHLCSERPTTSYKMKFSSCVHCNNLINGKTSCGSFYYFDIDKNKFNFLRRPPPQGRGVIRHSRLQESNGCLYCIAMISEHEGESVALWELQGVDPPQPWLLKYRVRISNSTCPLRFNRGSDGGKSSTLVTHDQSAGKIMVYSFLDQSYEELVDLKKLKEQVDFWGDVENLYFDGVHQFVLSPAIV